MPRAPNVELYRQFSRTPRMIVTVGALLALLGCHAALKEGAFACAVSADCPNGWVCLADQPDAQHCYSAEAAWLSRRDANAVLDAGAQNAGPTAGMTAANAGVGATPVAGRAANGVAGMPGPTGGGTAASGGTASGLSGRGASGSPVIGSAGVGNAGVGNAGVGSAGVGSAGVGAAGHTAVAGTGAVAGRTGVAGVGSAGVGAAGHTAAAGSGGVAGAVPVDPACSPTCGPGVTCRTGQNCGSGQCFGTCQASALGEVCKASSDCAAGSCKAGICHPTCTGSCAVNAVCLSADDCTSGRCTTGLCRPVCSGSCIACSADGDCSGTAASCEPTEKVCLSACAGPITITTSDDLLDKRYCKEIRGDLSFTAQFTDVTTTDLPYLKSVTGGLTVTGLSGTTVSLMHFNLAALQSIGGQLTIGEITSLVDVQFPALTTLGTAASPSSSQLGTFTVDRVLMPALTQVYGDLSFGSTDKLTRIDLGRLQAVSGAFALSGMPHLASINIPALTRIGGNLSLYGLYLLPYTAVSRLNSSSVVAGTITASEIGCCLLGSGASYMCAQSTYTCN